MKTLILHLTLLIVAVTSAFADPPQVKIGAIIPLTGAAAQFGKYTQNGFDLALEQMSAIDRARMKLIVEDDGLEPARSVSAARKLLDIDKVDALITWSSGTGKAVVSITEAKRIPMLSIASDPNIAIGKKYSFNYWVVPDAEAAALAQHLKKEGKLKLGLLRLTHPGVSAIHDAFVKNIKAADGAKILFDQEVSGEIKDFRPLLLQLRAAGELDAFIPIFFPGQLALVIKQARQLGITAPVFGFETFDDKDEIAAAGGAMAGAIFATGADPVASFIHDYSVRFPGASYYTANNAYDTLMLLAAATSTSKDVDGIVKFFESLHNYPTASGPVTSTPDHRFDLPTVLKLVTTQGVETYKEAKVR